VRGKRCTQSPYDLCVYFSKLPDGKYVYLLLYVDDMLIVSKRRSTIHKLKSQLSSEFEMKNLGEAKRVLAWRLTEVGRPNKFV